MKQKIIILIVSIFAVTANCRAKDSTLIFKFSAGIIYSVPDVPAEYNHPWYSHGGNGYSSLKNDRNIAASAILKAGIHKMFGKHAGLMLQLSYYHSKIFYTEYTTSTSYSNPVGPGTTTVINRTNKVRAGRNTLNLSLGPVFYIGQFYVSPKLDLSARLEQVKKDSTYSLYVYPTGTTERGNGGKKTQNGQEYIGGAGLLLGYDFKVGKNILFMELQSDYYTLLNELPHPASPARKGHVSAIPANNGTNPNTLPDDELRSRFRTAFTIGFGF